MFAPASTGNNGDEVGDQDPPSTFGVAHWICKISEICMGINIDGIMWGDVTDILGSSKRKAGFSRTAVAIKEGEFYL